MPGDVNLMKFSPRARAFAFSLLAVAACSRPQTQAPADGADQPDAVVPFTSDAITEDVFRVGCAGHTMPATAYTLPQSRVGQTVTLRLELPPHSLPVTSYDVEGTDAAAFEGIVDELGNTVVVFNPTQARTYSATVIAMTAGGPLARIALTGEATAEVGPLVINTPTAEIGMGPSDGTMVVVTNTSTTMAINLDPPLITSLDGGDLWDVTTDHCPRVLQPGEVCHYSMLSYGSALGCRHNRITFRGDTNTVSADIAVSIKSDVTFKFAHGTISSNTNQSCTSNCTLRFVDGPVTVTATPDVGYRFVGWSGTTGCTTDPSCTLRNNTGLMTDVRPVFVPVAVPQIMLTFAGTGRGRVLAYIGNSETIVCDRTCSISPNSATDPVVLVADTRSQFVGWAGACTGSPVQCNLGTATQDRSVTVTFDKDPTEIVSLSPPHDARGWNSTLRHHAVVLASGDILVATDSTISRMTTSGAVVWMRRANVGDLVVTPNGTVVYTTGWSTVYAFDQDGVPLWRTEVTPPAADGYGSALAVTPSGDIAMLMTGVVGVLSAATGTEQWRAFDAYGSGLGVDSAGNLAVATTDNFVAAVHRYSGDGTRILPDLPLGGPSGPISIASDGHGGLVVLTNQQNNVGELRRFASSGALVFENTAYPEHKLLTVNGDNIVTFGSGGGSTLFDTAVVVTSLAGVPRTRITTPRLAAGGIASGGVGRIALLGTEMIGVSFQEPITYPWLRVLQLP